MHFFKQFLILERLKKLLNHKPKNENLLLSGNLGFVVTREKMRVEIY
jgi:hypothetical protein